MCNLHASELHSGIEEIATEILIVSRSYQHHSNHIRTLVLEFFVTEDIALSDIARGDHILESL